MGKNMSRRKSILKTFYMPFIRPIRIRWHDRLKKKCCYQESLIQMSDCSILIEHSIPRFTFILLFYVKIVLLNICQYNKGINNNDDRTM